MRILSNIFEKHLHPKIYPDGNFVYLDYAASSPIDGDVLNYMDQLMRNHFANPGGLHKLSTQSREILEDSRNAVANIFAVRSEEIIFTRGGTEANNVALLGVINHYKKNYPNIQPHIITTNIEHASVRNLLRHLSADGGISLSEVPVDQHSGVVSIDEIKKDLLAHPHTILISIMMGNNEIGTLQPIKEIAKLVRWYKKQQQQTIYPLVHSDAIQVTGHMPIQIPQLGVDLLTISGSKIYGPKSVGALYHKSKTPLDPIMFGGTQEWGIRPGTEDVALIGGLALALTKAQDHQECEHQRLSDFRHYLESELIRISGRVSINGTGPKLPHIVSYSVDDVSGERLTIELDAAGFAVSSRSACSSHEDGGSHVIQALGKRDDDTCGSIRISMGRDTTKNNLEHFLGVFKKILDKIDNESKMQ